MWYRLKLYNEIDKRDNSLGQINIFSYLPMLIKCLSTYQTRKKNKQKHIPDNVSKIINFLFYRKGQNQGFNRTFIKENINDLIDINEKVRLAYDKNESKKSIKKQ